MIAPTDQALSAAACSGIELIGGQARRIDGREVLHENRSPGGVGRQNQPTWRRFQLLAVQSRRGFTRTRSCEWSQRTRTARMFEYELPLIGHSMCRFVKLLVVMRAGGL
jgi:hypothetical protein